MSTAALRVGPFRADAGPGPRSAVDACDGVDGWRAMLREHFVALDVDDQQAGGRFSSAVRSTLVGHLSVAEVASTRQSCVRTPRLARTDPVRYLQVGLLARGLAVVEQDGREAVVEPGRFVLYETDRPFRWHFREDWTLLVLTWPRHLVDLDDTVSRSATARAFGDGALGGIVARLLTETVLAPPPSDGAARLADELGAMVATTFGDHRETGDEAFTAAGAADLRRRVAAYIADHVEDAALGVEEIACAHHVSVRSLHRAFAGAGVTVGWLLRRLRLVHARQRLADPRDAHLSVTDVAHACGFADLPSFSRGFTHEFQENPSIYRRRCGARPR